MLSDEQNEWDKEGRQSRYKGKRVNNNFKLTHLPALLTHKRLSLITLTPDVRYDESVCLYVERAPTVRTIKIREDRRSR